MDDTVIIPAEGGYTITFAGPLRARTAGVMEVSFLVTDPDEKPARGALSAMLGDPQTDARASHTTDQLNTDGVITLYLPVDWPAGRGWSCRCSRIRSCANRYP